LAAKRRFRRFFTVRSGSPPPCRKVTKWKILVTNFVTSLVADKYRKSETYKGCNKVTEVADILNHASHPSPSQKAQLRQMSCAPPCAGPQAIAEVLNRPRLKLPLNRPSPAPKGTNQGTADRAGVQPLRPNSSRFAKCQPAKKIRQGFHPVPNAVAENSFNPTWPQIMRRGSPVVARKRKEPSCFQLSP